jgi:enoyl-CoA hydratase/carnithine racemase
MMLTGRTYGGTAALAMGLVNFCLSEGFFEAELDNLAREMLAYLGIPIARTSAFCWRLMARPSVRALRTRFTARPGWARHAGASQHLPQKENLEARTRNIALQ